MRKILITTLTIAAGVKGKGRILSMIGVDVRINFASSSSRNSRAVVVCRPRVVGVNPGEWTPVKIISPV